MDKASIKFLSITNKYMNKTNLKQLIHGGEQTLLNAVFVSLSSLMAIIALIAILIIK